VGLDGYEIAKLIDDPVGCPPIVVGSQLQLDADS